MCAASIFSHARRPLSAQGGARVRRIPPPYRRSCDLAAGKAEQTKTQLFQWLGFRSRSAPGPRMPSLGAVGGGVS
jgi:hypothetical protein